MLGIIRNANNTSQTVPKTSGNNRLHTCKSLKVSEVQHQESHPSIPWQEFTEDDTHDFFLISGHSGGTLPIDTAIRVRRKDSFPINSFPCSQIEVTISERIPER